MNKSAVLLVAAFVLTSATGGFAAGIGVQYNANAGDIFTNGIALNMKLDEKPVVFALSYYLGDEKTLGLTADYWLFNNRISAMGNSDANWFLGVGAFLSTRFTGEDKSVKGGVRVPLGVNMLIDKKIEPFFQVAPSIGLAFSPSIKATHVYFPISVGFRIWF